MTPSYGTGSAIVDAVGELALTGNVIPNAWFRTITKENGRPYTEAMLLLSEVVYWYRPQEVRDPASGMTVGWRRRFNEDLLRMSYPAIERKFGFTHRQAQAIFRRLETLGVIRRHFRVVTRGEITDGNVMYVELDPEALERLTYPPSAPRTNVENSVRSVSEESQVEGMESEKKQVHPSVPKRTEGCTDAYRGVYGLVHPNMEEISTENTYPPLSPSMSKTREAGGGDHRGGTRDVPPLAEEDAQALERVERVAPARTGGRHRPELIREWSRAISRTGLTASELADLYDLYLATPSLWPKGDEGNRLRWPLAWLTLPSGLEATMAHASGIEAARRRAEVRRMAPTELAMRAVLMPETSGPDATRAWVAQLPDGRAVYVAGSLVSSTSEDEARSMLASQLDGGIGGAA